METIAEIFGGERGRPGFQAGLRPFVRDGAVAIEFVYGHNLEGEGGHWLTMGTAFSF